MRTSDAYAGDVYVDVAGSVSIVSVDTQDQASGGDGYDEADLNKDGLVNFADFAALASQ